MAGEGNLSSLQTETIFNTKAEKQKQRRFLRSGAMICFTVRVATDS